MSVRPSTARSRAGSTGPAAGGGPASGSEPSNGWRGLRALGGVAAQGSQAVASLALQLLAARLLGLDGLAVFGTLYAIVILATAISGGLVGDSLTVLDRHDRSIRAGLQAWWVLVAIVTGAVAGLVSGVTGLLDVMTAVVFGAATAAFLLEDALRRLLMATLRFWRIVAVDLAGLVGAVTAVLLVGHGRQIELIDILIGLLVGQVVAGLLAVAVLPRVELYLVSLRRPAMRSVAAYGSWRAMQQALRPAVQAVVRMLTLTLVSLAAAGELEAARIYVAPAMIAVTGLSSVLFAGYASEKDTPMARLLRRTDRNVMAMVSVVIGVGVISVLALPVAGGLLTGGDYQVSKLSVIGWAAYAAAVGAATPYGALAAVRGRQRAVLLIRVLECVLALIGVLAVLAIVTIAQLVPFVLAVATLVAAWLTRRVILEPMARGA